MNIYSKINFVQNGYLLKTVLARSQLSIMFLLKTIWSDILHACHFLERVLMGMLMVSAPSHGPKKFLHQSCSAFEPKDVETAQNTNQE